MYHIAWKYSPCQNSFFRSSALDSSLFKSLPTKGIFCVPFNKLCQKFFKFLNSNNLHLHPSSVIYFNGHFQILQAALLLKPSMSMPSFSFLFLGLISTIPFLWHHWDSVPWPLPFFLGFVSWPDSIHWCITIYTGLCNQEYVSSSFPHSGRGTLLDMCYTIMQCQKTVHPAQLSLES